MSEVKHLVLNDIFIKNLKVHYKNLKKSIYKFYFEL